MMVITHNGCNYNDHHCTHHSLAQLIHVFVGGQQVQKQPPLRCRENGAASHVGCLQPLGVYDVL